MMPIHFDARLLLTACILIILQLKRNKDFVSVCYIYIQSITKPSVLPCHYLPAVHFFVMRQTSHIQMKS